MPLSPHKGSAVHYHSLVMTVLKIYEATHSTSKCRKTPVSLPLPFQHDSQGPALVNCPSVHDFCLEVAVNFEEHFHDVVSWFFSSDALVSAFALGTYQKIVNREIRFEGEAWYPFFHLFLRASYAEMWSLCTIAYCSIPMSLSCHSTTRPGMKPHLWWWSYVVVVSIGHVETYRSMHPALRCKVRDFILQMLCIDPSRRLTAKKAEMLHTVAVSKFQNAGFGLVFFSFLLCFFCVTCHVFRNACGSLVTRLWSIIGWRLQTFSQLKVKTKTMTTWITPWIGPTGQILLTLWSTN